MEKVRTLQTYFSGTDDTAIQRLLEQLDEWQGCEHVNIVLSLDFSLERAICHLSLSHTIRERRRGEVPEAESRSQQTAVGK